MTVTHVRARRAPLQAGHELEVLEKNTDTSWAMFQAIQQQHEIGFKKTEPVRLETLRAAPRAAGGLTLEQVMLEVRRNNRVCPAPAVWQKLFDYLPNKTPELPPVPASRVEWDLLPPLQKRSRLRQHIEWAAAQGVLRQVHEALKALPENRWHHMGD